MKLFETSLANQILRIFVLNVYNSQLVITSYRCDIGLETFLKRTLKYEFMDSNWFFGKLIIFTDPFCRRNTTEKGIEKIMWSGVNNLSYPF